MDPLSSNAIQLTHKSLFFVITSILAKAGHLEDYHEKYRRRTVGELPPSGGPPDLGGHYEKALGYKGDSSDELA